MNEQRLSERLERVAAHVPAGARLADIGSDHGYLLVALIKRGVITAAVAGEVAITPFHSAQRTVHENGLSQRVSVRMANGLAAIEPEDGITAISLCGMGGETIRDILDRDNARLNGKERLILQPNGGEQPLRHWLMATASSARKYYGKTASTTKSSSPSAPGRCCIPPRSCTSVHCNCRSVARHFWPSGNACCA